MLNESLHLWTKSDRIKYFLHSTTRREKKGKGEGAEQSGAKQSREEEEKQPEQINERMELETNEYVL